MCGIPAKKSRDRLDNGLLIDVPQMRLTYWRSLPDQANARAALVYGDTSYLRQGIAVLSRQHWE
jgi:hypothetical protein